MITKGSGLFSQHNPRAAAEYVSFFFFLIISIYQLPTSASWSPPISFCCPPCSLSFPPFHFLYPPLTSAPPNPLLAAARAYAHCAPRAWKINNIISTLSQFSINDFEVCLSRRIHHAGSSLLKRRIRRNSHRAALSQSHSPHPTCRKHRCGVAGQKCSNYGCKDAIWIVVVQIKVGIF